MNNNNYMLFARGTGMTDEAKQVITVRSKSITDEIVMDVNTLYQLGLMILEKQKQKNIPSDIVLADTLPLKHFKLVVKYNDPQNTYSEYEYHISDKFSVNMFNVEEWNTTAETLRTVEVEVFNKLFKPNELKDLYSNGKQIVATIGTIKIRCISPKVNHDAEIIIPLSVTFDEIRHFNREVIDLKANNISIIPKLKMDEHGEIEVPKASAAAMEEKIMDSIIYFYIIECALLNPVIRCVFDNDTKKVPMSSTKSNKNGKNKRAHIKYVKKVKIESMDKIDEAFKKKGFIRHTMVWYVTGHWRKYKSGKKIFIQGYWKGALRDAKSGESRDREIVFYPDDED